jgi:hypothetical protein
VIKRNPGKVESFKEPPLNCLRASRDGCAGRPCLSRTPSGALPAALPGRKPETRTSTRKIC